MYSTVKIMQKSIRRRKKMATRKVKLSGIAEWAKVFEQNRDHKGYEGAYEDFDGACTIDLIIDDDNLNLLQASRSMKKGSPDKEGRGTKVTFVRKFDTGRDWDSGPPVVLKSDDTPWNLEADGLIGNGSKVEVHLAVYDTKRRDIVGTRLDKIKVLDLVKYVSEASDTIPPPQAVVAEESVLF
mgnify:FL=1